MHSLAVATLEQKKDASFMAALGRLSARYAKAEPTPSPVCAVCLESITDTAAVSTQAGNGKTVWMHFGCAAVTTPSPVISGIETDGTNAQDNRPSDADLNRHYLTVNDWQKIEVWLDPKTGLTHLFNDALAVQSKRDASGWSVTD